MAATAGRSTVGQRNRKEKKKPKKPKNRNKAKKRKKRRVESSEPKISVSNHWTERQYKTLGFEGGAAIT